jgi:hypothetical protein
MGLKTLFTQAFPQKLKDYYDAKISALEFNKANTATGADSVTLNTTSGVAIFTDNCEIAPSWIEYLINNSLITSSSLVSVNVQIGTTGGYCSLVNVNCSLGLITVAINDGFTGSATNPIVTFTILG